MADPSATADGTDLTPIDEADFKELADVLSDALLASYLLGREQIQTGDWGSSPTVREGAAFAEGDDKKKKRQPPKGGTPSVELRFDLPPQEAIDYFKAKKIVRKKEFNQLSKEAQQSAFTVSGVYKEDVLRGFKEEIDTALREGATQQQTIKRFKAILSGDASQEMLGDYHLETVFRVNMGTAYDVGRRRGMEEVTDAFPFWEYHGVLDDRERPSHVALEGITLPANNPFWDTHYGHWEWGCRCVTIPTDVIPEGYDPKHPNGDESVTLSYNDDGSPAKAEIGTSLIDLQVSKSPGAFRGVPRGASMLTAIEAGVERARQNRLR